MTAHSSCKMCTGHSNIGNMFFARSCSGFSGRFMRIEAPRPKMNANTHFCRMRIYGTKGAAPKPKPGPLPPMTEIKAKDGMGGECTCKQKKKPDSIGSYHRAIMSGGKSLAEVTLECQKDKTCSGFSWVSSTQKYAIIPMKGGNYTYEGECGFGPPTLAFHYSVGLADGYRCFTKGKGGAAANPLIPKITVLVAGNRDFSTQGGHRGDSIDPADIWRKKSVMFRQPNRYDVQIKLKFSAKVSFSGVLCQYDAGATMCLSTDNNPNSFNCNNCYATNGNRISNCQLNTQRTGTEYVFKIDSRHSGWNWFKDCQFLGIKKA